MRTWLFKSINGISSVYKKNAVPTYCAGYISFWKNRHRRYQAQEKCPDMMCGIIRLHPDKGVTSYYSNGRPIKKLRGITRKTLRKLQLASGVSVLKIYFLIYWKIVLAFRSWAILTTFIFYFFQVLNVKLILEVTDSQLLFWKIFSCVYLFCKHFTCRCDLYHDKISADDLFYTVFEQVLNWLIV